MLKLEEKTDQIIITQHLTGPYVIGFGLMLMFLSIVMYGVISGAMPLDKIGNSLCIFPFFLLGLILALTVENKSIKLDTTAGNLTYTSNSVVKRKEKIVAFKEIKSINCGNYSRKYAGGRHRFSGTEYGIQIILNDIQGNQLVLFEEEIAFIGIPIFDRLFGKSEDPKEIANRIATMVGVPLTEIGKKLESA